MYTLCVVCSTTYAGKKNSSSLSSAVVSTTSAYLDELHKICISSITDVMMGLQLKQSPFDILQNYLEGVISYQLLHYSQGTELQNRQVGSTKTVILTCPVWKHAFCSETLCKSQSHVTIDGQSVSMS
jgi:hypothetical protein